MVKKRIVRILEYGLIVLVGVVVGLSVSLLLQETQPESEIVCLSGYVTIESDYGHRLVLGDMEICGRDLEIGNIIGPSRLYDPGDPI